MFHAGVDQVDKIVDRYQTAAVVDGAERERNASRDGAHQRGEVRTDPRPVHKWWPDDDDLNAGRSGERQECLLRFELGDAVRIGRRRRVGFAIR